jgi:hypothetical protein
MCAADDLRCIPLRVATDELDAITNPELFDQRIG